MHVPGLRVVAPTIPYDAKGLLIQSIRDDNPVIFVDIAWIIRRRAMCRPNRTRFRSARPGSGGGQGCHPGRHLAYGSGMSAGRDLSGEMGIEAEVIDPVSLSPLDLETISASVRKTGRLLVVDSAWTCCGATAEIVARRRRAGGQSFGFRRFGFAPVLCPTTKALENLFYPDVERIAKT